jgi:putative oxidoreductase
MKLTLRYNRFSKAVSNLSDLPLLIARLVLAYGFFKPAMMKWGGIGDVASWFDSMGIPLPYLNALLAASAEALGVILLFLGLGTRIIAIPLMFTMLIATITVHLGNGFEAGNNGFEIPLYYAIILFGLIINGSGKLSLDHLISRKRGS